MSPPDKASTSNHDLPATEEWDVGVFNDTLVKQRITLRRVGPPVSGGADGSGQSQLPVIKEGTISGTARALTEVYSRILQRLTTYHDLRGSEPHIPLWRSVKERQSLYRWSDARKDNLPPHLHDDPPSLLDEEKVDPQGAEKEHYSVFSIFDLGPLLDIMGLIKVLLPTEFTPLEKNSTWKEKNSTWLGKWGSIIDDGIEWAEDRIDGSPDDGKSLDDIEKANMNLLHDYLSIYYDHENVGNKGYGKRNDPPWYTDEVFAQQHLTGPNPVTITLAQNWIGMFQHKAQKLNRDDVVRYLDNVNHGSLYVQDYSYFRDAVKVSYDQDLTQGDKNDPDGQRWTVASVCLFELNDDGRLHPLGIVIDWRGSMDNSVVIFNKHLKPGIASEQEEKEDWPWRYAKTCVQSSDWLRHEAGIHLTETHFVEEATIVAAHRAFEPDHPVYRLLQPHWLKTLSLNHAARKILLPEVVIPLTGLAPEQANNFVQYAYQNFNWTQKYVPADLTARGFPPEELLKDNAHIDPKYKNYAYGRNMIHMWNAIRTFVKDFLTAVKPELTNDDNVLNDKEIQNWCKEMRASNPAEVRKIDLLAQNPPKIGANMGSFPIIKTFDELVDAVTMCIHIASPQHTAVNYLQEYFQVFVINKPPALFAVPPTSPDGKDLMGYDQKKLMEALPVNKKAHRQWLLAAHVPHLLNSEVGKGQTLVNCAKSWRHAAKPGILNHDGVAKAATDFYHKLTGLDPDTGRKVTPPVSNLTDIFAANSKVSGGLIYDVLDPNKTAVSVLI
ncbi:lipoxygenase [Kalaharituber pfeilii]|nr:lipoxygenase [Kalaharituber pfeilii]